MAVEIKVPAVGESVTEGIIGRWLKANGTAVRGNEPLGELETDKATQEVAAPASGVLRITAAEGQTVSIGAVIGQIETNGAPAGPVNEKAPAAAKETAAPDKEIAPARATETA